MTVDTQTPVYGDVGDHLRDHGLTLNNKGTVAWLLPHNDHPRHWPSKTKSYNACYIMFFEAFGTAMGSAGSAAAAQYIDETGTNSILAYFAFTGMNLLGQAANAIVFPPLSETFGRKQQFVWGSLVFAISCGLTVIPTFTMVFVGRFLSGFSGGIPSSIAPGALEDTYAAEAQVWALFGWATVSNIGLVLGPIVSSYIVATIGWRWVFYIATITGFAGFAGSLRMRESRPNLLLKQKVAAIQSVAGADSVPFHNPDHFPTWTEFVQQALLRPARLLFTEPIVTLCSLLNGVAFGLIYGLTEALSVVYSQFGFSEAATSLAFVPVLVGVLLSTAFRIYDHYYLRELSAQNRNVHPEAKIRTFAISAPVLAIGLWIFGWTVPPSITNVPWIASMIGLVFVGLAANDFDTILAVYLTDSYMSYAASAFAALAFTRSMISTAFSIFTEPMFKSLGSNTAVSILAAVATVFALSPIVLIGYGAALRARSPFARYSLEISEANVVSSKKSSA